MSRAYAVQASLGAGLLLVLLCNALYSWWFGNKRNLRLPPGPKPIPLLGNILQVPNKYKEKTFTEWGKTYGDIVYTRFLRTPVIFLNSLEAAQELMEKKSAQYSDRPRVTMISSFVGWGYGLSGMGYGDRCRKHRKWIHDAMGTKASLKNWLPLQQREVYNLLTGLCDKPELLSVHANRWAAATLVELAYGYTVTSLDDMYVQLADKAVAEIEGGYPGLMLVDFLPMWLVRATPLWFPGPVGWFVRKAVSVRAATNMMHDTPYEMVKKNAAAGTARPSFTASLLAKSSISGLNLEEEHDIKGAAGVLYGAGTETTVSILRTFFLAMALHPDVFEKAREEINRVVGKERLPDANDREGLPYLECVLEEVYRWGCPVVLGLTHRLTSDDEYKGYYLPGGSTVYANIWAMSRDERFYPDAHAFHPERFQNLDHQTAQSIDPRKYIFGLGRRVCPGLLLADGSLWLAMANVIAALDVTDARDLSGEKITPSTATWESGFISQPVSYAVDIRPRSPQSLKLIQDMGLVLA